MGFTILKPMRIVLFSIAVFDSQHSTCVPGVIPWLALCSLPFKWLRQWLACVSNLAMGNRSSQQYATRKLPRTISCFLLPTQYYETFMVIAEHWQMLCSDEVCSKADNVLFIAWASP